MKKIKLTKAQVALVDDADYAWLSQWKWSAVHTASGYYAYRYELGRIVRMHRQILNVPAGMQTDHIDHDGLNNQRANIRICTAQQNQGNRGPITGKYKGVRKDYDQWRASIGSGSTGTYKHLGMFKTAKAAARAYDEAAVERYGEFAQTNF